MSKQHPRPQDLLQLNQLQQLLPSTTPAQNESWLF